MKIQDLMESMDLAPVTKKKHEKFPQGVWSSAFPKEWTQYYDIDEVQRQGKTFMDYEYPDEPPKNPNFREDLELNLSNANMVHIISDVLGFSGDSREGFLIPINEFIARATQWLQRAVGKLSAEVPTEITKGEGGPTMIDVGRREGYENQNILQAVKIAREGKQMGATHISAH